MSFEDFRETKYMEQMAAFCRGKWQWDMPEKEGMYAVATSYGEISYQLISVFFNGITNRYECSHSWKGWWWSEPMPVNFGLPPVFAEDNG